MNETDINRILCVLRSWKAPENADARRKFLSEMRDRYYGRDALYDAWAWFVIGYRPGWTCFHCGDYFTDPAAARIHFGAPTYSEPGCIVKLNAEERSLLKAIQAYEADDRRRAQEDTELHRQLAAKEFEMRRAVRDAEEAGYAKGLKDGREPTDPLGRIWETRLDACGNMLVYAWNDTRSHVEVITIQRDGTRMTPYV